MERITYPRLIQPLPIIEGTWIYITIDFIERLPKSIGCNLGDH
jgi:hypothetical protein